VNTENDSQQLYQAGRFAFERGEYRLSIEQLEQARQNLAPSSLLAGEAGIWLVSAYQGMGNLTAAQTLCRQLTQHPNQEIRQQAIQILYILEAPQLKRPEEWMTKIPEMDKLPESEPQYQRGSYAPKPPSEDWQESKDNQFVWVALGLILLLFGVWFWLTQV
jgi:tetratricopeptide (TPR) repeat protein